MNDNEMGRVRSLLDRLVMWRYRLTYCPRYGHHFGLDGDYCLNCGKEQR